MKKIFDSLESIIFLNKFRLDEILFNIIDNI